MICPGYVKTEMNDEWFDSEAGAKRIAKFPPRRIMAPNELDTMLLHLSCDDSGGVTGASFTIDDGQSL